MQRVLTCAVLVTGALGHAETFLPEEMVHDRRLLGFGDIGGFVGNVVHHIQGGICSSIGAERRLFTGDLNYEGNGVTLSATGLSQENIAMLLQKAHLSPEKVQAVEEAESEEALMSELILFGISQQALLSLADAYGVSHVAAAVVGEEAAAGAGAAAAGAGEGAAAAGAGEGAAAAGAGEGAAAFGAGEGAAAAGAGEVAAVAGAGEAAAGAAEAVAVEAGVGEVVAGGAVVAGEAGVMGASLAAAPETFGASLVAGAAAVGAMQFVAPHLCNGPDGEQKARQAIAKAHHRALQSMRSIPAPAPVPPPAPTYAPAPQPEYTSVGAPPSTASATAPAHGTCGKYPEVSFCRNLGLRDPVAFAVSKDAPDQSTVYHMEQSIHQTWAKLKQDFVMKQVLYHSSFCDQTIREGICMDAFKPCDRRYTDACTIVCTSFQSCLMDTFHDAPTAKALFQEAQPRITADCLAKCKAGSTIMESTAQTGGALYEKDIKAPTGLGSPFGALAAGFALLMAGFAAMVAWKRRTSGGSVATLQVDSVEEGTLAE